MRSKKAIINITVGMLLQLVTLICGLITPRLILGAFGSSFNGITSSVTQFLSIISLLRAGVGGVTRASLYKPLAENDTEKISSIVRATERFMRKIALIFLLYVVVLACVYPFIIDASQYGGWLSISSYVLILAIGTFAQYFFAITYQLLLTADQREYVYNGLQIVQTLLNTIVTAVFIFMGASLHVVKLAAALAYLLIPIFLNIYVKKRYNLNKRCEPDNSALTQRWDAFAHNLADFIHGNTDLMVLTVLAGDVALVSVYSVYYMIVNGVKKIITLCTTGLEAAFGNMLSQKEFSTVRRMLKMYEFCIYVLTTLLFSCVMILICSFINVYTSGINDINYYRPSFAFIAVLGEALYCMRIPYSSVVYASGHFKQTRNGAITEALLNLSISIVLILTFNLAGFNSLALVAVAIGTFIANTFRTVQFMIYLKNNILKISFFQSFSKIIAMVAEMLILTFLFQILGFHEGVNSYIDWIVYGVIVFVAVAVVTLFVSIIFFRSDLLLVLNYGKELLKRRKG